MPMPSATTQVRSAKHTPSTIAEDLHRLISALGGGPVDIFASSGVRSTRWRW
jgi:hypothetical protein